MDNIDEVMKPGFQKEEHKKDEEDKKEENKIEKEPNRIIEENGEEEKDQLGVDINDIKEEPQIEIKTVEDLDKITEKIDRLEINELKESAKILEKIKSTKFKKLEVLALNTTEIDSI